MMRKVLIKGIGMISALGLDRDSSFQMALSGKSAVSPAPASILEYLPHALAAQLPNGLESKLIGTDSRLDRATQLAMIAAREAIADAGFKPTDDQRHRVGIYAGIGLGGAQTIDSLYVRFVEQLQRPDSAHRDPTIVNPLTVPRMMANAAAAGIAIENRLHGPTYTFSVACSSSAIAIGEAYRAIRHGYIDTAIVLGTEAMINLGAYIGWNALRVMAKPRADAPETSCRPFDAARTGFSIGEGSAAMILEAYEGPSSCSRKPYAEICGFGTNTDGTHITMPSSTGQVLALNAAIKDSGLSPEAIGYINAHGTATDAGDITETQTIRTVFGAHADHLAVSSTKGAHGHTIGAAGAIEFALSVLALQEGHIPPTANLDQAGKGCDLDFVPKVSRKMTNLEVVMSNSFAFGGTNASLIAKRV
jgi:3-oxoacyl-[acyl-carrier-protein] synthase II